MGKMALGGEQWRGRKDGRAMECGVELLQLPFREGQEEALEKDNRFAQTGIEVVMGGVEEVPLAFRLDGGGVVEHLRGTGEGFVEIFNKFEEGGDFMKKLRALAEEDPAANSIEAGGAAALGLLKIFRIKRTEIGSGAKVLGMGKHGAEKSQERIGEPFAKHRSNREGLMGFDEPAIATKSDGFIQIDTEHGVRCFKPTQRI
jgi:hypothetical protein